MYLGSVICLGLFYVHVYSESSNITEVLSSNSNDTEVLSSSHEEESFNATVSTGHVDDENDEADVSFANQTAALSEGDGNITSIEELIESNSTAAPVNASSRSSPSSDDLNVTYSETSQELLYNNISSTNSSIGMVDDDIYNTSSIISNTSLNIINNTSSNLSNLSTIGQQESYSSSVFTSISYNNHTNTTLAEEEGTNSTHVNPNNTLSSSNHSDISNSSSSFNASLLDDAPGNMLNNSNSSSYSNSDSSGNSSLSSNVSHVSYINSSSHMYHYLSNSSAPDPTLGTNDTNHNMTAFNVSETLREMNSSAPPSLDHSTSSPTPSPDPSDGDVESDLNSSISYSIHSTGLSNASSGPDHLGVDESEEGESERTQIMVLINLTSTLTELSLSDWDDEKERLYSEGLATSLDISLSSIKILSVLDGSIVITSQLNYSISSSTSLPSSSSSSLPPSPPATTTYSHPHNGSASSDGSHNASRSVSDTQTDSESIIGVWEDIINSINFNFSMALGAVETEVSNVLIMSASPETDPHPDPDAPPEDLGGEDDADDSNYNYNLEDSRTMGTTILTATENTEGSEGSENGEESLTEETEQEQLEGSENGLSTEEHIWLEITTFINNPSNPPPHYNEGLYRDSRFYRDYSVDYKDHSFNNPNNPNRHPMAMHEKMRPPLDSRGGAYSNPQGYGLSLYHPNNPDNPNNPDYGLALSSRSSLSVAQQPYGRSYLNHWNHLSNAGLGPGPAHPSMGPASGSGMGYSGGMSGASSVSAWDRDMQEEWHSKINDRPEKEREKQTEEKGMSLNRVEGSENSNELEQLTQAYLERSTDPNNPPAYNPWIGDYNSRRAERKATGTRTMTKSSIYRPKGRSRHVSFKGRSRSVSSAAATHRLGSSRSASLSRSSSSYRATYRGLDLAQVKADPSSTTSDDTRDREAHVQHCRSGSESVSVGSGSSSGMGRATDSEVSEFFNRFSSASAPAQTHMQQ